MPTLRYRLIAALMVLALLAACENKEARVPDRVNFTAAVDDYLAQRGHLCIAKYDWPITVIEDDRPARKLEAQQLSVLETLGLAASRAANAPRGTPDAAATPMPAREYALTAEGQKYYLRVPVVVATAKERVTHQADFCVARLTLDRVFGWEPPQTIGGRRVSSVLFSYRIADPAPWLQTPDVRRAFPMLMRAIDNAGTLQLRLGVHLTQQGWVADELSP